MLRFWIISSLIICFVHVYSADSDSIERNEPKYLLITPSRIISGTTNKICVSRLGLATFGRATSQIEILTTVPMLANHTTDRPRHIHKYIARARKIFFQGNGGCFDVLVPRTPHRKVLLHFRMRFDTLPQYKVDERKEITLQHDANIIVVQLNKPLYRAGETVKLRVLQLRPDLTPLQLPVYRISIETPPNMFGGPVKVVQWFNVSTQLGLVQREYTLDKYAQQGEWRIVVDSRDSAVASTLHTFTVTDYMLPTFFLTVNHDRNVLATFKQLMYSICARYMYGEGVNGKLAITMSSDSYDSQKIGFTTQLNDSRGCYNYTIRTKLLGFESQEDPKIVIADIAFQEDGTKEWKNSSAVSHVSKQVVRVSYVNKHNANFKPGIPYKVKVRVTDWDDKPVADAKLRFCKVLDERTEEIDNLQQPQVYYDTRTPSRANSSMDGLFAKSLIDGCGTGISDPRGHASFTFSGDEGAEFIQLKTIVLDHPLRNLESGASNEGFASASLVLYSWGNHSRMAMEVGAPLAPELRLGSRHSFPLFLTIPEGEVIKPITVHYALITRSGIIFRWSTSTQCPSTVLDVQNMQSVSSDPPECPAAGRASKGTVYKMAIHVKISHHMCPHSHLLVYHMRPSGELIVASKRFKVDECFLNKVSQQWIPDTVPPSSPVKLQLRSNGPALCVLGVTRVALHHVAPRSSVHSQVVQKLMSFIKGRHTQNRQEANENICFSGRSLQIQDEIAKQFYDNTLKTFLNAGLELMTDLLPQRTHCPETQAIIETGPDELGELSSRDRYPKDRSYFPETWLWDLHVMDSKGLLEISTTVPDEITEWENEVYCISRSGIATPPPDRSGVLKVMQPFFVDLHTPKVMKRGEDTQMYYKIFNYMDQNIPVSIDLEVLPSAAASVILHEFKSSPGHVSCIPRSRSLVSHFTVKAHQLRNVVVTVAVQILNNMQHRCHQRDNGTITNYDVRDKIVKEIIVQPEGYPVEKHKSALLCTDDLSNKTDITWTLERSNCVDQSENWFVSVVGDVTGPMSMNLDNLISLPMGCGEQNLALLAYNLIALDYAAAGKRVSGEMKEKALQHLEIGYQRQLQFRHPSGAFSAFGPADPTGSTWLTTFSVRCLRALRAKWGVGAGTEEVVENATRWLLARQMENGCFKNEGQVFHREMKGGLRSDSSSIALAAYIIISLIDAKTPLLTPSVIKNAAYCLAALKYNHIQLGHARDNLHRRNPDKMYAFALATLAQIKIEEYFKDHEHKNEVMAEKNSYIKRHVNYEDFGDDGSNLREYVHNNEEDGYFNISSDFEAVLADPMAHIQDSDLFDIEENNEPVKESEFLAGGGASALHILRSLAHRDGDGVWWEAGSLSVSIETTGYAMLGLLAVGGEENILDAVAAARWLSLHRTSQGGFLSTQDTLVALQALCVLRNSMPDNPPSLSVTVRAPGRGRHFSVTPPERHKLHTVIIKAMDCTRVSATKLSISAEGKGCLLVQSIQRYNTLAKPMDSSPFRLFSKVTTDGSFACKENQTWCMCAAVLEVCVSWEAPLGTTFPEMALLEVQLPTGYSTDRSLLYGLIAKDNILLRRVEESPNYDTVYLYLSLHNQLSALRPSECYDLYLVGPKMHTLPAAIRVYDYYHADTVQTMTYSIPESCPYDRDRRPHEEPMDLVTQSLERGEGSEPEGFEFGTDWHVIDSDYDLETPRTIEGVPPTYVLPPANFNMSTVN